MPQSPSLCLKVLSLAVVVWAVLYSSSLADQAAMWVPWVVLALLMLLEAYAAASQPPAWSHWAAGLTRLLGPGMLPYYVVLVAFLAIGPGQVRRVVRSIPTAGMSGLPGATVLQPKFDRPESNPTLRSAPNSPPARPTGFPGNAPRPGMTPSAAPGQTGTGASGTPGIPPRPSSFPTNPAKSATPQSPVQPPSAQQPGRSAVAPTSSAKPPSTPAK